MSEIEGSQADRRLRKGRGWIASSIAIPDIYRLRAFLVLADELNYRRAAEKLMMRQSPLSQLIISLERDAGIQLFARNRHMVRLTSAGESFRVDCKNIILLVNLAVERARMRDSTLNLPRIDES